MHARHRQVPRNSISSSNDGCTGLHVWPARRMCRAAAARNHRVTAHHGNGARRGADSTSSKGGQDKYLVFVRHGHSTWNELGRIQGNTNESELTDSGLYQAERIKLSLSHIDFDSCFASPHTRSRQSAEIIWDGKQPPIMYLDSLREANLGWFQGQRNEDVARSHPELYSIWRNEPHNFNVDGRFPVLEAFEQAQRAWADITSARGHTHLIVTHKSIMRAMLCTAFKLPPSSFRMMDISNGGICIVRVNGKEKWTLSALNWTAHILFDGVFYELPNSDKYGALAESVNRSTVTPR